MPRWLRYSLGALLAFAFAAAAWIFLNAWLCKEAWLTRLWLNAKYMLHQEWFVVPLVVGIYFVAFLFVRWQLIAWPTRLDLHRQIGNLQVRLTMESSDDPEKQGKLEELARALTRAASRLDRVRALDRILWSRGQELANSRHVSQVELELNTMQPDEGVLVRLEIAEQELVEIPTKNAAALAETVKTELAKEHHNYPRLRRLLHESLSLIYGRRDDDNDSVLTWHNKTLWLTSFGLLMLLSLEGVRRGGAGLFALGATGGFMSRLMRTLKKNNVPVDYGAYWTTLFLSPLVGALAGWTGVILVVLSRRFGILGDAFKNFSMGNSYDELALGVAFLLGFSERLFDEILAPLEERIGKKADASSSSAGSSSSRPSASSPSSSGSSSANSSGSSASFPSSSIGSSSSSSSSPRSSSSTGSIGSSLSSGGSSSTSSSSSGSAASISSSSHS